MADAFDIEANSQLNRRQEHSSRGVRFGREKAMKIGDRNVTKLDIFILGVVGIAILSMIIIGIVVGWTWSLVALVFWIIVGLILGMRGMLRRRG